MHIAWKRVLLFLFHRNILVNDQLLKIVFSSEISVIQGPNNQTHSGMDVPLGLTSGDHFQGQVIKSY